MLNKGTFPDHFKTKEMCVKALEIGPWFLKYIPDQYNTKGMCEKAVENESENLEFVPD